jgi:hypothetical protein
MTGRGARVRTNRSSRSRLRAFGTGLLVVAGCLPLAACTEVESAAVSGYQPAALEPVEGRDDVKRVTFSREGAERTGLRTAPVRRVAGRIAVPYAAVIYDPEGRTYVYTSTGPLSFLRQEVEVDRVEGSVAFLLDGPPAGSRVVTVGAVEVYGTELEIAGGH